MTCGDTRAEPLLEVRNLHCAFQIDNHEVEVIRGVDLHLRQGEILALVGESGCGKTITMRSMIGLLPHNARVSAERFIFAGMPLHHADERAIRALRGSDIAMIFQDPMTSLNPLKRIGQHLTEILIRRRRRGGVCSTYVDQRQTEMLFRRGSLTRAEAWLEAEQLLAQVGINGAAERLRQFPHELSGGMRQRVLIAMALACRPRLLIADEPTTALDVTIQARLLALLRKLQQDSGMTVVLITHDLGVVASLCHHVAVMYAGLIMEEGRVEDIFYRPQHPYTKALLRSIPSIYKTQERLVAIEGQPPSALAPQPGCPFAPRCPQAQAVCRLSRPPLNKVAEGHNAACFFCLKPYIA